MTSLKNYSGDEIAASLAEQLNNEEFVGLYRKAEDAWWTKGRTAAAFKQEVDAAQTAMQVDQIQNKYLAGGEMTTALGQEGIDDHQPLREYADAKAASLSQVADDGQAADDPNKKVEVYPSGDPRALAPEMTDEELAKMVGKPADDSGQCAHGPEETCQKCAEVPGMAVAVDFANRHLSKIAGALDAAGFVGLANEVDGLAVKFAAKKKKKDDEEEKEEKKGKKKDKKKEKEDKKKAEKEEKESKKKDKKKKEEQKAKDKGKKKK